MCRQAACTLEDDYQEVGAPYPNRPFVLYFAGVRSEERRVVGRVGQFQDKIQHALLPLSSIPSSLLPTLTLLKHPLKHSHTSPFAALPGSVE